MTLVKYNELSDYDLTTEEKIVKSITTVQNKLNKKIDIDLEKIVQELSENKDQLTKLEENLEEYHEKSDINVLISDVVDIIFFLSSSKDLLPTFCSSIFSCVLSFLSLSFAML